MYRDYWYLKSEEEDGPSPESDSDLGDYADDTDLNVSLDSEDGTDPDGSEADIKTILNMHNPTMLFAGRVTSRTNQQAATGSPPSTQTQQPLHLVQPLPPQQLAQLRRGSGARVSQYLPRLMLGMILLIGVAGSTAGGWPCHIGQSTPRLDQPGNHSIAGAWAAHRSTSDSLSSFSAPSRSDLSMPGPQAGSRCPGSPPKAADRRLQASTPRTTAERPPNHLSTPGPCASSRHPGSPQGAAIYRLQTPPALSSASPARTVASTRARTVASVDTGPRPVHPPLVGGSTQGSTQAWTASPLETRHIPEEQERHQQSRHQSDGADLAQSDIQNQPRVVEPKDTHGKGSPVPKGIPRTRGPTVCVQGPPQDGRDSLRREPPQEHARGDGHPGPQVLRTPSEDAARPESGRHDPDLCAEPCQRIFGGGCIVKPYFCLAMCACTLSRRVFSENPHLHNSSRFRKNEFEMRTLKPAPTGRGMLHIIAIYIA